MSISPEGLSAARLGSEFRSPFRLGDRVKLDGDAEMTGRVTGFNWRHQGGQIEVSWFHNGSAHSSWFDDYRVSHAEDVA